MKKLLLATASLAVLTCLGGCVSPYPGAYSTGAYAGYDGGFDDGYHGYQRPVAWAEAYTRPVSYAPPYGYYGGQQGYAGYGYAQPQMSGWYSTYYCPPQMGGYGY